jgi:diamine N-acetyltransferase
MSLKLNNISLRTPEPQDLDLLYIWENDPSVWMVSQTLTPYSKYNLEEYIRESSGDLLSRRQTRFMIDFEDTSNNITIGTIDLFEYDPVNRRAGIGILIGQQEYRLQGHATTAIQLMQKYAFTVLHLEQIYCTISEDNESSIRLFEKSGFLQTGRFPRWIRHTENWKAALFMQCFNRDE